MDIDLCNNIHTEWLQYKKMFNNLIKSPQKYITDIKTALNTTTDTLLNNALSEVDKVLNRFPNVEGFAKILKSSSGDCEVVKELIGDIVGEGLVGEISDNISEGKKELLTIVGYVAPAKKTVRKYVKSIAKQIKSNISDVIDSNSNSALSLINDYKGYLKTSGILDMMKKLDRMEKCLQYTCGLISQGDRAYTTFKDSLNIDDEGDLNYVQLVSGTAITASVLASVQGSYDKGIEGLSDVEVFYHYIK